MVHLPPNAPEQGSDPPVTILAEPGGQTHNGVGQDLLVVRNQRLMALGRAGLFQYLTSPPPRCSQD